MNIIIHSAIGVLGVATVCGVLLSAIETVVLPRHGFTIITRTVFALADRILVHRWGSDARASKLRNLYAPVALVCLPLVWMMLTTVGFMLIFWSVHSGSMANSLEISGSSLFTLGFSKPPGISRIWVTFIEATIGLGLVALLISYLPTIYAAYNAREFGMSILRPFSGTPPNPVRLVLNLDEFRAMDNPDVWSGCTSWLLGIHQSHRSFPALCYFPESSPDRSWVASVGALLDGCALLLATADFDPNGPQRNQLKHPMMILAHGLPSMGDVARASAIPCGPPASLAELLLASLGGAPVPEISVTNQEFTEALDQLDGIAHLTGEQREEAWHRFSFIRSGYDLPLRALAALTDAYPAPWTTDRPATVGRMRLWRGKVLNVDWSTTDTPRLSVGENLAPIIPAKPVERTGPDTTGS